MRSMSRLRDPAEYFSKAKHRWSYNEKDRRVYTNSVMDLSRSKTSSREARTRWRCTDGPGEFAGKDYWI
ncbi:unnamed protein product [Strongylus vulgaris]|uniref:Uncharacterized protein n=1 Tax=Strongylus vulgaris TaxID=40348 RepID=A0A3P7IU26_STRVU|nr:unnamed protein product [Strongylus vulgaris]